MLAVNWMAILFSGVVLFVGLFLHLWSVSPAGRPHFNATTIVAWLLIALFPVLVLFSFFPDSEVQGTVLGVSAGGAVALFLVIWSYGPIQSRAGKTIDDFEKEIKSLRKENENLVGKLSALQKEKPESLRHSVISHKIEKIQGKSLDIITGDLTNVMECDCWVNSENTYMQMSRFFERSISAAIRYHGARHDEAGNVVDDLIADELHVLLNGAKIVQPTSVYITSAGMLEPSNGVKFIAHVAAVTGQVGVGWVAVDQVHRCVGKVLRELDRNEKTNNVRSVLFPLIGTGQAANLSRQDEIIHALFCEALDYLSSNKNTRIDRICFLASTDVKLESCQRAIQSLPQILPG